MNLKYIADTSFKLLFTVLFPGIISWKGASDFHGGELFFRWEELHFLVGGAPHKGHQF